MVFMIIHQDNLNSFMVPLNFLSGPLKAPDFQVKSVINTRKVCEGSEYMSKHTSEVRGRVLGGGVHTSESKSEY